MKKQIAIILCLITCFCVFIVPTFATDATMRDVSAEEVMASSLKELGLFIAACGLRGVFNAKKFRL